MPKTVWIGLTMEQFHRRLGSDVVVIEGTGQITGHEEDADVASALQQLLEAEGIEFRLNSKITRIERANGQISVWLDKDAIVATHLFVATGRRPNTDDLGLETVGVKTSEHGLVEVDNRLATNVQGIWAAGDIRGGPML